jgi:hypothetical protein
MVSLCSSRLLSIFVFRIILFCAHGLPAAVVSLLVRCCWFISFHRATNATSSIRPLTSSPLASSPLTSSPPKDLLKDFDPDNAWDRSGSGRNATDQ